MRDLRIAGGLLAVAGAGILMSIVTAEALYPAPYFTDTNTISDLGGSLPPHSVVLQPSATIFDLAMIVAGILLATAAVYLYRAGARRGLIVAMAFLGVGVLGVGVFPGVRLFPHQLFALSAFMGGGVAAILSSRHLRAPARQFAVVLGAMALVSLALAMFLMEWGPIAHLGEGGIERWVAYPTVLWMVLFGGALTATDACVGPPA
jgi:hypothetical membrane protein